MPRYFIRFSYDGTLYHGWQIQPGDVSVQEVMTERMKCLFGADFSLTGAGRTDAGVHAASMWAHFDLPEALDDPKALISRLNRMLPDDIAVQDVRPVRDGAHARFDAVSRTYEYRFTLKKDPFARLCATPLNTLPDVDAMQQAADILKEYTDFTSFSKLHTDVKTNNCRIMRADWQRRGDLLVFTVQADRFLRNMVRAIVGTLLEVGRGKLSPDGLRAVIEKKDRCAAGQSMPPQGLFLTDVAYPEDLFLTPGD